MADVRWIKITTNMFEDDKIDFIQSLPEADAILLIWIRLLTLAGKCNAGGFIFLTENIPYTEEMLAHKFRKPTNIVKLALHTLQNLGMISIDQDGIFIVNWEKHQNIEGLERIREQTRIRVAKHRERKRLETATEENECNVTVTPDVTPSNATDIDIEIDKEEDIDQTPPYQTILDLFNETCKSLPKVIKLTDARRKAIRARYREYGDIEAFEKLFTKAESSDFLSGRNGKWTNCNFEWLMKPNNMIKVLEGNYDNPQREKPVPDRIPEFYLADGEKI